MVAIEKCTPSVGLRRFTAISSRERESSDILHPIVTNRLAYDASVQFILNARPAGNRRGGLGPLQDRADLGRPNIADVTSHF